MRSGEVTAAGVHPLRAPAHTRDARIPLAFRASPAARGAGAAAGNRLPSATEPHCAPHARAPVVARPSRDRARGPPRRRQDALVEPAPPQPLLEGQEARVLAAQRGNVDVAATLLEEPAQARDGRRHDEAQQQLRRRDLREAARGGAGRGVGRQGVESAACIRRPRVGGGASRCGAPEQPTAVRARRAPENLPPSPSLPLSSRAHSQHASGRPRRARAR